MSLFDLRIVVDHPPQFDSGEICREFQPGSNRALSMRERARRTDNLHITQGIDTLLSFLELTWHDFKASICEHLFVMGYGVFRPRVGPYDGPAQWVSGPAMPCHGRFSLVCDTFEKEPEIAGKRMENVPYKPITLTLSLAQPLFSNFLQASVIQASETLCISSGSCSCHLFSRKVSPSESDESELTLDWDNIEETQTEIVRRYLHIDQK